MKTKRTHNHRRSTFPQYSRQWWVAPVAFLATLLALPVNAGIGILPTPSTSPFTDNMPDVPLTTGNRVAPNVLFILDDSGSMTSDFMPDDVPSTSAPNISRLAYTRNTLSYNPGVTYLPWMQANGSRMTTGVAYDTAHDDLNLATGTLNLGIKSRAFLVPKNTVNPTDADLGDGTKYYLYKLVKLGADVVRTGTYGAVTKSGGVGTTITPAPATLTNNNTVTHSLATVASALKLEITITSTNNRGKDFRVKNPLGVTICSGSVDNSAAYLCAIDSTDAGVYKVEVKRNENNNATYTVTANTYTASNRCGLGSETGGTATQDWINCSPALPNTAARNTVAKELVNYATWYSYYRTRMKAAKAGASEAFRSVGYKSRVGFRKISEDSTGTAQVIPVATNDGRFGDNPATIADEGANRIAWYNKLFATTGSGYTPLRSSLAYAGKYFERTDANGPYGPETGAAQLSCRQNFTILTTDGYWNTNDEPSDWPNPGDADNSDGSTITGPKSQSYKYTAAAPYSSSDNTTLADIAMYYWKRDLRTDTSFGKSASDDNNVPVSNGDPAFWQHMVTFGISIGLKGSLDQSSVAQVLADGTPKKNGAAVSWPNPISNSGIERIDDLMHAAVNGHGSFVAASSPTAFAAGLRAALSAIDQRTSSYSNVATNSVSLDTDAQVFNASYTAGVWTGALNARSVTVSGVSETVSWSASIPTSSRKVLTSQGGSLVDFLVSTQAAALARPVGAAELYPVSAVDNAAYIAGDQTNEESNGKTLRNRNSLLGDIVGSSPAFVKDTNTLYVGANDGMLHAFDAADGKEVFAYIPGIIDWNALRSYSSGEYSHRFFVDGPIVVSNRSLTPNKNILVGALGKGGTGLYALDVTTASAPVFKWDMKDTPAPSAGFMGKVLSKPVLGNVNGSASVILGNGVDSASNKAALIIVKGIDTSSPATVVVDTGVGSATTPNALFAPTAVLGKDGKTVAYVYAGDMLGNLWKFNLTTTTPTVTKLFAAGTNKPITGGVTVAIDPKTNKRWVFFGTGRFLIDRDLGITTTQSMYGIIDSGALVADSDLDVQDAPVVNGDKRSFQAKTSLVTGKKGWRVDLPVSGERIVQDMQVVSTFLVSASMIPSGDACGADGRGYINALDAFSGTSAGGSYFDVPGNDTIDGSVGGIPIGSVDVGNGMPTLPNLLRGLLVVGGTGGSELRSLKTLTPRWDRVSWREVRTD